MAETHSQSEGDGNAVLETSTQSLFSSHDDEDDNDSRSSSPDPPPPPMLIRPQSNNKSADSPHIGTQKVEVATPPTLKRSAANNGESATPPQLSRQISHSSATESSAAPPPLKRMSTNNSHDSAISATPGDSMANSEDEDEATDIPSSTSLFSQSASKTSSLDSLLGKIIATKQTVSRNSSPAPSTPLPPTSQGTAGISQNLVSDTDSSADSPSTVRKGALSPDPNKSRRKQVAPIARVAESPTKPAIAPDLDEMLTSCEMVEPEAPNLEIDIPDDEFDEEFRGPMRVSRKGRVVKKPSWADAYTTEDDGYDWTPERLPKKSGKKEKDPDAGDFASPNRNFTDSFRPRAAPTFAKEASLTHEDLPSAVIYDNPPPSLMVPFKTGWKRELVLRNPTEENVKKSLNADAYYYAPKEFGSVKLRSLVKVQDFLQEKDITGLTTSNFSFMKKAFHHPPEEYVRHAGKVGKRQSTGEMTSPGGVKVKELEIKSHKNSPKVGFPVKMSGAQPVILSLGPGSTGKHFIPTNYQILSAIPHFNGSPALKRPAVSPNASPMKKIKADASATERAKHFLTSSPDRKIIAPAGKPPSLKNQKLCDDKCEGVFNKIPTVQCGVCLLLYHPECVNWATAGRDALFICSICIQKTRKDRSKSKKDMPLLNRALNVKAPAASKPKDKTGRLITIPLHVLSKIDTKAPFALKLNNETFVIDPSRLIKTATGVKIFIKNDQVVKPDVMPKPEYSSLMDCYKKTSAADQSKEKSKSTKDADSKSDDAASNQENTEDSSSRSETSSSASSTSQDSQPIKSEPGIEAGKKINEGDASKKTGEENSTESDGPKTSPIVKEEKMDCEPATKENNESGADTAAKESEKPSNGDTASSDSDNVEVDDGKKKVEGVKSEADSSGGKQTPMEISSPSQKKLPPDTPAAESAAKQDEDDPGSEPPKNSKARQDRPSSLPVEEQESPELQTIRDLLSTLTKSVQFYDQDKETYQNALNLIVAEGTNSTGAVSPTLNHPTDPKVVMMTNLNKPTDTRLKFNNLSNQLNSGSMAQTLFKLPSPGPKICVYDPTASKTVLKNITKVALPSTGTSVVKSAMGNNRPISSVISNTNNQVLRIISQQSLMSQKNPQLLSATASIPTSQGKPRILTLQVNPTNGKVFTATKVVSSAQTVLSAAGGLSTSGASRMTVPIVVQAASQNVIRQVTPGFPRLKNAGGIFSIQPSNPLNGTRLVPHTSSILAGVNGKVTFVSAGSTPQGTVRLVRANVAPGTTPVTCTSTMPKISTFTILSGEDKKVITPEMFQQFKASMMNKATKTVHASMHVSTMNKTSAQASTTNKTSVQASTMNKTSVQASTTNKTSVPEKRPVTIVVAKPGGGVVSMDTLPGTSVPCSSEPKNVTLYMNKNQVQYPATSVGQTALTTVKTYAGRAKPVMKTLESGEKYVDLRSDLDKRPATTVMPVGVHRGMPILKHRNQGVPTLQQIVKQRTLNRDCVLHIFSYLTIEDRLRASSVCKMWRAVSTHPSLSQQVVFDEKTTLEYKNIKHLLTPKLTVLKLPNLKIDKPRAYSRLIEDILDMEDLRSLTIIQSAATEWLTEHMLVDLLCNFTQLQSLTVTGGARTANKPANFDNTSAPLSTLRLHDFPPLQLNGLLKGFSHLRSLRELSLKVSSSQKSVTDVDLFMDHHDELEGFRHTLKKLTSLKLVEIEYSRQDVDESAAEYLQGVFSTTLPTCKFSIGWYDDV